MNTPTTQTSLRIFGRLLLLAGAIFVCLPMCAQDDAETAAETAAAEVQDAAAADDAAVREAMTPRDVEALAEGEVRVLEAIIIDVKGRGQWRSTSEDAWKRAEVDDVLQPGAMIRTGLDSRIALRVGMNATLVVDGRAHVALPELVQAGNTLRTRAALSDGRVDFKVERVGLTNDFQVITPTTTLAVKGTGASMTVSALDGVQVYGVRDNMVRAIELMYLFRKLRAQLGHGRSSARTPDPALNAMHQTVGPPASWAAALDKIGDLEGGFSRDTFLAGQRQIQFGSEFASSLDSLFDEFGDGGDGGGEVPDFFGGFENSYLIALFICDFEAMIFGAFEQGLASENLLDREQFSMMRSDIGALCEQLDDLSTPLELIVLEIVQYCEGLNDEQQTNRCFDVFGNAFGDVAEDYFGSGPPR